MFKAFCVLAIIAGGAVPASAAVMRFEMTGQIANVFPGTDGLNIFGQGAGASLAGQDFTSVFIYDTAFGSDPYPDDPDQDGRNGGTSAGSVPTPIRSASLEIGGVTTSYAAEFFSTQSYIGYIPLIDSFTAYQYAQQVMQSGTTNTSLAFSGAIQIVGSDGALLPRTLDTPFEVSLSQNPVQTYFDLQAYDANGPIARTFLWFNPAKVKVSVVGPDNPGPSPVPLPAALPLLAAALGGLVVLRRRRVV